MTLSYCIALRTVSFKLKKRFPSLEHLVLAGIMREDELAMFHQLDTKVAANKWFLPLVSLIIIIIIIIIIVIIIPGLGFPHPQAGRGGGSGAASVRHHNDPGIYNLRRNGILR